MTDPEIIKYIDRYCVKNGEIEAWEIKENGSYNVALNYQILHRMSHP